MQTDFSGIINCDTFSRIPSRLYEKCVVPLLEYKDYFLLDTNACLNLSCN
jgi:hypothetical protein